MISQTFFCITVNGKFLITAPLEDASDIFFGKVLSNNFSQLYLGFGGNNFFEFLNCCFFYSSFKSTVVVVLL